MTKTKKFKTISGYLRSHEGQIVSQLKAYRGSAPDQRCVAVVETAQRQVINNLLQQIGMTGRIADAETPSDGVARLGEVDGKTPQQVDALVACRRWLRNFAIPISFKTTVTKVEGGFRRTTP